MQRFPDRWYEGGHHADYGWLALVLFLALLAALAFIAFALWRGRPGLTAGATPVTGGGAADQALSELRLRYARGDIEREDYLRRAADLGDTRAILPPSPPEPPSSPPEPPEHES
jgi:putative membrane protein